MQKVKQATTIIAQILGAERTQVFVDKFQQAKRRKHPNLIRKIYPDIELRICSKQKLNC